MVKPKQRFGKLVTVALVRRSNGLRWECICDCGNTSFVRSHYLTTERSRSCGCAIIQHQKLRKLNPDQVVEIFHTTGALKETAKKYDIHPSLVSRIRRGLRSAHITGSR
jgi:hypothetical protein